MEGITNIMEPTTLTSTTEAQPAVSAHHFAANVQNALKHYFNHLEGTEPTDLYNLVLAEMEIPLLKMMMRFTADNQSKAAKILGISRGTLRKKLALYQLN